LWITRTTATPSGDALDGHLEAVSGEAGTKLLEHAVERVVHAVLPSDYVSG
jgi:hypothetical protein